MLSVEGKCTQHGETIFQLKGECKAPDECVRLYLMKYKICPHCGRRNSPTAFDCQACYTDLISVRVTDEQTENAVQEPLSAVKPVRICESCGFANPVNARKCQSCGEDISDILPVEDVQVLEKQEAPEKHFFLESLDGRLSYEVQPGKTIIGREEMLSDYLENKRYVSRCHAELTLEEGKLTVQNLSGTNYTFVNNRCCVAETVELNDGDAAGKWKVGEEGFLVIRYQDKASNETQNTRPEGGC